MPPQFDALRQRLLAGGIAPRHARRYLGELADHLADLTARQCAMGYHQDDALIRARAALGGDTELAQAMIEQKRFRSWAARAPWAVFGLLPLVAALAALFVPTLLLVVIAQTHNFIVPKASAPDWFRHLAEIVANASNLLLAPLVAALFLAIALRQRLPPVWPLLASAVLVILCVRMNVNFPATGQHGGSISVGILPIIDSDARRLIATQWPWMTVQWFLTLLPGLWFLAVSRARILPDRP